MRKKFNDAPVFAMKSAGIILTAMVAAFMLNGCGGGGGGGGINPTVAPTPPPRPPSQPPPSCINTSEGCLTPARYRSRINAIKQTHSNHKGFRNQWGLGRVNAHTAWAHLQLRRGLSTAPGAGLTLGAIDSGIDEHHNVFAGKRVDERFYMGGVNEDGRRRSHGTAVASVMVGNPSQNFINSKTAARGVAYGADITMFAVPTSGGEIPESARRIYNPMSLAGLRYWNHTTLWPAVINGATGWFSGGRSLDFVNVSLGHDGLIDFYSASDLNTNFGNVINALRQTSGSSSNTVFVWSAGNSHGTFCTAASFPKNYRNLCNNGKVNAKSPQFLAGLPARISSLRSSVIAVVSVDSGGSISWFSNRCGIAADWCIAAPGRSIRVAYFGPNEGKPGYRDKTFVGSGTSFAAPYVTGGLGVMKHFFRSQLSNAALVRRLYATANKSGRYSNRGIYGQGLMDLAAALAPAGSSYVAMGNRVDDGGRALGDTYLNLGTAFGDGLSRAFAGREMVAFDRLGAPFWYSFGGFAGTQSTPSMQWRLKKFMNATNDRDSGMVRPVLGALSIEPSALNSDRLSLGLMDAPDLVDDGGHLSLLGRAITVSRPLGDKLGFSLFSNGVNGSRSKVSGMEFVSRPREGGIAFRGGLVAERQTLLNSSAGGAFGRMSGSSAFAGLDGRWQAGAWRLGAGAEVGTVVPDVDHSLLSLRAPLTTSAFALRAQKQLARHDTVAFTLSQPLRIESGRADYSLPVGRTIDGEVLRVSNSVDLEPSGRQVDLSAQWRRSMSASNGDFRLAASLSNQPGHNAAAEPQLSILAGWRIKF